MGTQRRRGRCESSNSRLGWGSPTGVTLKIFQQGFLVVFAEALRDVEARLAQSRNSPLQQLLTEKDIPTDEQSALVEILVEANSAINQSASIEALGTGISEAFADTAGPAHAMKVQLGMAEPTFSDIARRIKVFLQAMASKRSILHTMDSD